MQEYINVRGQGLEDVAKLMGDIHSIAQTTAVVTVDQGNKVMKIAENVELGHDNVKNGNKELQEVV